MKNKKGILILSCAILAAVFLLGVSGVLKLSDDSAPAGEDALIGVLVTTESIDTFDMDGWMEENIGTLVSGGEITAEDTRNHGGRVWADLKSSGEDGEEPVARAEYEFKNIDGFLLISPMIPDEQKGDYRTSNVSQEFTDVNLGISENDQGTVVNLQGTLWFVPGEKDAFFYMNSVYQTADGRVYALPGECLSVAGGDNTHGSIGMSSNDFRTRSENGREVAYSGTEYAVTIRFIEEPEQISLLQFSGDNVLVKSETFAPGALPASVRPEPDTEYFIVDTESKSMDGQPAHSREIFSRPDALLSAFAGRGDGFCTKQCCEILWEPAE